MKLVWKLLRRHVSLSQLAGFFMANFLGLLTVLLGLQFYYDVKPLFVEEDGFIRPDYLILSKHVTALDVLGLADASTFTRSELDDLGQQPFSKRVGAFTASQYKVKCSIGLDGVAHIGTEMFFESVPDAFVDADMSQWHFAEGDEVVPIILPRMYLALYNFGFAQSHSLPKLSEGIIGMVDMTVNMRGNGREENIKGRVIGFSNRLNTILVPESFIRWSNEQFAPEADTAPTRVILEVSNPADDAIVRYINAKGYELEDEKLDAGRMTFFLRITVAIVMSVGLLICCLAFYVLMLSIYLLVEKNTEKMRTLLLIGFSPARVAFPYQALAVGMNFAVLLLTFAFIAVIRTQYMEMLWNIFPKMQERCFFPTVLLGLAIFVTVSIMNVIVLQNLVKNIWNNKN